MKDQPVPVGVLVVKVACESVGLRFEPQLQQEDSGRKRKKKNTWCNNK